MMREPNNDQSRRTSIRYFLLCIISPLLVLTTIRCVLFDKLNPFGNGSGKVPHDVARGFSPSPSSPKGPPAINGEEWYTIDIVALFGPPDKTRGKGLIVVPGHGSDTRRREILLNNTQYIPFDRFDCVVFVYADMNATDAGETLDLGGCRIVLKKGNWVQFQWMINPELVKVAGYTSVTLMMDDVSIVPRDLVRYETSGGLFENGFMLDHMFELLVKNKLSSASPNVFASDHEEMYKGLGPFLGNSNQLLVRNYHEGFRDARINEVQLVMFQMTDSGWPCFHTLLDPEQNPTGWGPATCYKKFCNASLGLVDDVVIHYGRPSVFGNLPSTVTANYAVCKKAMHEWALRQKTRLGLSDWPDSGEEITKKCYNPQADSRHHKAKAQGKRQKRKR